MLRTTRSPLSVLPEVRQAIWAVNPNLQLAPVSTLDSLPSRSPARTSFALVMLMVAAIMALALGAVGIYGVISFFVAQRTREIGVRVALGAPRADVTRLVVGQGGRVALLGIAVGLGVAVAVPRFMSATLFGVSAVDPPTYVAAALGVGMLCLVACYAPARRAAGLDPMRSLRAE